MGLNLKVSGKGTFVVTNPEKCQLIQPPITIMGKTFVKLPEICWILNKKTFYAQENESRYSDIFVLILVALFQKRQKAAFSKIKTTSRVALFLSTFSR